MTRPSWCGAVLACAAALVPSPVLAQESPSNEGLKTVRIADLVTVLVRQSPSLALAQADASIARAQEQSARGREDLTLNASANYSRAAAPPTPGQPVQLVSQTRTQGEVGLAKVLPTGGQVNLSLAANRQSDKNQQVIDYATGMMLTTPMPAVTQGATSTTAKAQLSHPLLRGFGQGVARAEREKAQIGTSTAILKARQAATEALRDALNAYWELVYAASTLEARRTAVVLAREQLDETRTLVRAGVRPIGEQKAAEYGLASREEALLLSQIELEDKSLALRKVAGLDLESTDFRLWPIDRPPPTPRTYDITQQVRRGLARNPNLAVLQLEERSAAIDQRVARDGLKPRLDLNVGAGVTGTADTFDESFNAIESNGYVDVQAGATFTLELGRNAAYGASEAARQQRRKVRINLEQGRRDVASQIVLSVHRIEVAQKRIEVSSQSVDLARATLDAERARYRAGKGSNFEVFQRQDEVDKARLARARATADYHQAVLALAALTGDLLTDYHVEVIDK